MRLVNIEIKTDKSLILYFDNGAKRIFHIDNILKNKNLAPAYRKRWEIMYNKGLFKTASICEGVLEWPGWVEILPEEFNDLTVEL